MDELNEQLRAAMPFGAFLGLELITASAYEVRALMGLADSAGGFCAFLNLPEGAAGTATIESKTNFFSPVREGYVEAVSRPLHKGRTTIVVETDLFDAAERRVARVTQTQAILT